MNCSAALGFRTIQYLSAWHASCDDDARIGSIAARREVDMPTLDERVAFLEGAMNDHNSHFAALRTDMHGVRGEIAQVRGEMAEVRSAMGQVRSEMGQLREETGRRFEAVDRNFAELRRDMSGHFMWLVGILVTSAVGTVTAIVASFLAVR